MPDTSRIALPAPLQNDGDNTQSSPIERLSDDLLIAIVMQRVRSRKQASQFGELPVSRSHPLITASHVSRRWRQLVLASPSLWCDIAISTPILPPSLEGETEAVARRLIQWMQNLPEVVRTWIDRSQNCPLSISMHMSEIAHFSDPKVGKEVRDTAWICCLTLIDLLCDVAGRWRVLELDISLEDQKLDQSAALKRFHNLRAQDVPLLEELDAGLHIDHHLSCPPPVKGGIQMGRSLRSLKIPLTRGGWQDYGANWSGLTELHVDGFLFRQGDKSAEEFGAREALALLKACPNLVTCTLALLSQSAFAEREVDLGSSSTPVTMGSLEALDIRGACPRSSMAKALVLPSLRELVLLSNDNDSQTLKCWLGRFGRGLRALQLELPLNVSPDDMDHILDHVPNVTSLGISVVGSDDIRGDRAPRLDAGSLLLQSLTMKSCVGGGLKEGCFCPKLKELFLSQEQKISDATILDFVQSRRSSELVKRRIQIIKEVTVFSDGDVGSDLKGELLRRGVDTDGLYLETL
ncbi:hypothetical protein FA13DRAFT_1867564 [Coprinellus micaceus]|uniref:F-box domain-containing protein n=1 Tax=Coprinellus micaceus TaxID=71717 RepID=A0A4Y7TUA6_COPMI|nr:hypothetical protein FA13DRAFT_1867564 [Coprinellus micaceus]